MREDVAERCHGYGRRWKKKRREEIKGENVPEFERELHVSQKVPRAPEEDRPGGQALNSTHAWA